MPISRRLIIVGLLAGSLPMPLYAQDATAPAAAAQPVEEEPEALDLPAAGDHEEIIVTGTRIRGRVDSDIPPEVQLNEADIQAYGVGSIAELLEALEPLTRSARGRGRGGRPVILLNGQRISGFSEVRNLPTEAIERVDILPEEVALRYGYRADQRVVNFVLKPNFSAVTTEVRGGFATAGGRSTYGAEANVLNINSAGRWNIEAEYRHQTPLFESERNILLREGALDEREYRTLLSQSDEISIGGTFNRMIGEVGATINGRLDANSSRGFIGLPPSGEAPALTRETDTRNAHVGVVLNGAVQPVRWSFTGNFDRGHSESVIGTGTVPTTSQTFTQVANAQLVATSPLLTLPAGEVTTSVRIGAEHQGLRGESTRGGIFETRELSRGRGNLQASLDVPIASRRMGVLEAIGDLSVNLNGQVEQLSDFGTLTSFGAGLNWSPIQQVRVIASFTNEDGAPSMQQLGNPSVLVPNVRVFDFLRGTTVDVSRLEGGNPNLLADNRQVWKLGLTVRPLEETDLTLRADYTNSRVRNPIVSFPTATPEIEAAFADRFVRDSAGNLISIDARPVNFARSDRSELRWGLNYSRSLGQQNARGGRGEPGGEDPAAGAGQRGGGMGRGGGGGMGRGGGGGTRLQFGLFHTWHFTDQILIREGVPVLDLLNGSAVGSTGGQPRHEIEAQAGISGGGLGARASAQWRSGTRVNGAANGFGGTTGDLDFSGLTTVNLRLFANLDQQEALIRNAPWLSNTRVTLSVNNLFDSRLRVTDAGGFTPISYQPDYLDPLGRSVMIGIRKQF